MKNYTWKAYYTDGKWEFFYCKKNEIFDYMSVRNFAKLDRVEIVNNAYDSTKHRAVTKEQLAETI